MSSSASAHVLQLVRAHYHRDESAFCAAAQALARGSKVPQVRAAILEEVRAGRYRAQDGTASSPYRPTKPSSQLQPLATHEGGLLQTLAPLTFADLLLDDTLQGQLDELVIEIEYREALAARNLRPRSRLLFHGPPGNGKTSAAVAIANALGVPAYAVNFAELVSSFVGGTGKNLGELFSKLTASTLVVFDEVDAVGSARGTVEQAASKEMNANVNILLTLLDRQEKGIIVATTNRPDILDPALLRRFDEHVYFPEPNEPQKRSLADRLCRGHEVDPIDCADCRNFDEVTKRCRTYARRIVMQQILTAETEEAEPNEQKFLQ